MVWRLSDDALAALAAERSAFDGFTASRDAILQQCVDKLASDDRLLLHCRYGEKASVRRFAKERGSRPLICTSSWAHPPGAPGLHSSGNRRGRERSVMTPTDRQTVVELLAALCDRSLSPEQMRRLDALVCSDAEFRRLYVEYLDLHARLSYQFRQAAETAALPAGAAVELPRGPWVLSDEGEIPNRRVAGQCCVRPDCFSHSSIIIQAFIVPR